MDAIASSIVFKGQQLLQNEGKQQTSEQDTTSEEPRASNCKDFFNKRLSLGGGAVTEDDTF